MGKRLFAVVGPVAVGGIAFIIGVLAIVALYLVPAVADGQTAPQWVYLCTPLAPVGLLVSIIGIVLADRR